MFLVLVVRVPTTKHLVERFPEPEFKPSWEVLKFTPRPDLFFTAAVIALPYCTLPVLYNCKRLNLFHMILGGWADRRPGKDIERRGDPLHLGTTISRQVFLYSFTG